MNANKTIIRFILGWIALSASQMLAGMLIHVNTPPMPNVLPWLMVSNAFVVLALGSAALRSEWIGWRLGLALFAIPAVIMIVNLIEGVLFLTNLKIDWRGTCALTLAGYALAAVLWTFLFGGKVPTERKSEWEFPQY